MSPKDDLLLEAHIQLSQTLRDTHYGHSVREHRHAPSAVEFAKAVGENTPFIVRGIVGDWPAIDKKSSRRWTNEYLLEKLGDRKVTVSLTGDGYADAVRWVPDDGRREVDGCAVFAKDNNNSNPKTKLQRQKSPIYPNGVGITGHGTFAFTTPYEAQLPFLDVMHHLTTTQPQSTHPHHHPTIAFCQLQNDCLRSPTSDYFPLLADVPDVIPTWARPVLGDTPEAVNYWMGRAESVTTLHSDPFENIYTVVRGVKVFTLYPPCDAFFFGKRMWPLAKWVPICGGRRESLGGDDVVDGCENDIATDDDNGNHVTRHEANNTAAGSTTTPTPIPSVALLLENTTSQIPWIPITHPTLPAPLYPYFSSCPPPFTVRVHAGDSLYLPRGWLHMVEQEEDEDGVCVAVNTWYEGWEGMGPNWAWGQFVERVGEIVGNAEAEAEG